MQIATHWHQIFGEHEGRLLSTVGDCNAFAVETSAGLVLFDAGTGIDPEAQQRALAAAGFPEGPKHLFLTHGHADHAGGASALASRYAAVVYAGPITADWLGAGNEAKISLPSARRGGVYPPGYVYRPVQVDHVVTEGATILLGDVEITPVATPGHSADHWSYVVGVDGRSTLIAGDALFAGGTVILQDTWDSSVAQTCASIRRMRTLAFDAMLSGHGPPVLSDAVSHVDIAMQRIDRLLPPLNLL